jgi:hypothetical protein
MMYRDNPYKWQLRALVNAVHKYDCAIDLENPTTKLEDLNRLYGEMLAELEVSVLILGGEDMLQEHIGSA